MTKGTVSGVIANMVTLAVDGPVKQGEICYIETGGDKLMSEVIKVVGSDVYVQVFESTRGLRVGAPAEFTGHMLEVQLGPGMLSKNYDGLQNDLDKMEGVFLKRGQYTEPLDKDREWDFIPLAKVGDENHIVRPGLARFVDGLLQPDTQPLARLVGQKIVHRLAGLVQNVLDRGFCIGVRGNRSDEADFQVAGLQNAPGLKHRLPACDAEIRAGIAAVQSLGAVVERFKPVIELVVARHGQVIAKAVHHPDDLSALGDGPDGGPLYGVSGVDQQNVVIDRFEFLLIQGQPVVADVVFKGHVRIVGVQDHRGDLLHISWRPGVCEGGNGEQLEQ